MAGLREIVTKFTIDGLATAQRGLRSVGETGAGVFNSLKKGSLGIFDGAISGVKKLGHELKHVSYDAIKTGAEVAFVAAGVAAIEYGKKIKELAKTAKEKSEEIAESLEKLGKDKERTGWSVEDLSALHGAAKDAGVDPDSVIPALERIGKGFADVKQKIAQANDEYDKTKSWAETSARVSLEFGDQEAANEQAERLQKARSGSLEGIHDRQDQIASQLQQTAVGGQIYNSAALQNLTDDDKERVLAQYRLKLVDEYKELQNAEQSVKDGLGPTGKVLFELQEKGLDVDKILKGDVDAFFALGDAIKALDDPTERSRVAIELFGKSGANLLPLLMKGSDGFREYREELEKSGNLVTEQDTKIAEEYEESVHALQRAKDQIITTVAHGILPLIATSNEQITKLLSGSRQAIASYFTTAFEWIHAIFEDTIKLIEGKDDYDSWLFKHVDVIVKYVESAREIIVGVAKAAWSEVKTIFTAVMSIHWIDDIEAGFTWIKQLALDIFAIFTGGNATSFKWLNTVRDEVVNFFEHAKDAFEQFLGTIDEIKARLKPIFEFFGENVTTGLFYLSLLKFSGLLSLLLLPLGLVAKGFGNLFSVIFLGVGQSVGLLGKLGMLLRGVAPGAAAAGVGAAEGVGVGAAEGVGVGAGVEAAAGGIGLAALGTAALPAVAGAAIIGGGIYTASKINDYYDERANLESDKIVDGIQASGDAAFDAKYNAMTPDGDHSPTYYAYWRARGIQLAPSKAERAETNKYILANRGWTPDHKYQLNIEDPKPGEDFSHTEEMLDDQAAWDKQKKYDTVKDGFRNVVHLTLGDGTTGSLYGDDSSQSLMDQLSALGRSQGN